MRMGVGWGGGGGGGGGGVITGNFSELKLGYICCFMILQPLLVIICDGLKRNMKGEHDFAP